MPPTIRLGRLDGEVRQTLARAGIDPRHATVVLHTPLEREHAENRRRYAQCIPDELHFEFATATLVLDEAHRIALVAHEVGHCIAWRERGEHGEDDADEAAARVLGIPICYDLDWPGKGLQVDCRIADVVAREQNPRRRNPKRGWPKRGTPPADPRAYVRASALEAAYRANYFKDGQKIASSRTTRPEYPRLLLGTWKIDDEFRNMYGYEIDELVLVDDPRVLEPGEFDWSDPTKALRQSGKLEDMERYAQWMSEGHSYPPISVVETERGTLRITDGHRRAAAADAKGMPVKAWISWLADHPDPPRDQRGNIVPMKVGLTYELATGQEWTMPRSANPVKQRLWRAANDDIIVGTASFSPDRDCAEAYLDNQGFGGTRLWTTEVEVDDDRILDLREDGFRRLRKLGVSYAQGANLDWVVPHIAQELQDLGFIWVRHPETYPADCDDTWTFVGVFDDEPELEEVDMDRETNPKRKSKAKKKPTKRTPKRRTTTTTTTTRRTVVVNPMSRDWSAADIALSAAEQREYDRRFDILRGRVKRLRRMRYEGIVEGSNDGGALFEIGWHAVPSDPVDRAQLVEIGEDQIDLHERRALAKNPPKGPPFTPHEVEEIREDIGQCVSQVADRRKLSAKYDEVAASDEVVPVRMKLTRRGAQQSDLFGNPHAAPADMTDRALLDEIYDLEETGGPGALKRTQAQWDRLDALLDEVLLRQKEGRFSTRERNVAIGNPFYMTEGTVYQQTVEPDDLYFVPTKKTKTKGGSMVGIMVRIPRRGGTAKATQTSLDSYSARLWHAVDPAIVPDAVRRAFGNRGVTIADNFIATNPRRRNLQPGELKYDGPIARARHGALRSGKLVPSDSVADAGTGAYMALVGSEIFHIDTDGFVYVIAYDDAAEAKDDYDYLVGKFPKLMNPRRPNALRSSPYPPSFSRRDKEVVDAFLARERRLGEKLQTDGHRLSLRPSDRTVAQWDGDQIREMPDTSWSTFVREVQKSIRDQSRRNPNPGARTTTVSSKIAGL